MSPHEAAVQEVETLRWLQKGMREGAATLTRIKIVNLSDHAFQMRCQAGVIGNLIASAEKRAEALRPLSKRELRHEATQHSDRTSK